MDKTASPIPSRGIPWHGMAGHGKREFFRNAHPKPWQPPSEGGCSTNTRCSSLRDGNFSRMCEGMYAAYVYTYLVTDAGLLGVVLETWRLVD